MNHTYYVACTARALDSMKAMTLDAIQTFINNSNADECNEHLALYCSFEDLSCEEVKKLDERFKFIRKVPVDQYAYYKHSIMLNTVHPENLSRHLECKTCNNWEQQPFDQQRHHFGSFTHFGDDVYKCFCKSKAVEVDVEGEGAEPSFEC